MRHHFVGLLSGLLLSTCSSGQTAEAGRNLPGLTPQLPTASAPAPTPAVEAAPARSAMKIIGRPHGKALRQIVFTSDPNHASRGSGAVTTGGVAMLERKTGFIENLMVRHIGQPLTAETAGEIAKETLDLYSSQEHPVVFIQPLEVNYRTGIVKIGALESKVDTVRAKGARWFGNETLARQIRLQPGAEIDREKMLNDLAWVNENSFLKANVMLQPGAQPGTTALELEVQDRFPVRFFGGLENTGSRQSGEWRWLMGANWGTELLGQYQQLSYQFSAAAEDIKSQPVHTASWSTALPWHHRLSVSGSWAGTQSDVGHRVGVNSLTYEGEQWQFSPRYSIPIGKLYGPLQQTVSFGADWKRADFMYRQDGTSVPTNATDVVQAALSYEGKRQDRLGETRFSMDGYWSPGGIGSRNRAAAYRQVDPRLRPDYVYGVANLGRTQNLAHGFSLNLDVTGHLASDTLPSSEQLAIGGYGTVRGYQERVVFGDSGVIANLELRAPTFSPSQAMSLGGQWRDQLQLLAFFDFGLVSARHPLPHDSKTETLASVGIGARYRVGENLSIRADLGFPLIDPDLGFSVDPRVSVGVLLSY